MMESADEPGGASVAVERQVVSEQRKDDPIEALERLAAAAEPRPAARPAPAVKPATQPVSPAAAAPPQQSPQQRGGGKPAPAHASDPGAPAAGAPGTLTPYPVNPQSLGASGATPRAEPPRPPRVERLAPGETPPYRCLYCGYPIAEAPELRCLECGRKYTRERLEPWFDGTEQQRFDHVLWLVVASLFLRLFLIQPLLVLGRLGNAILIAWACWLVLREEPEGPRRFYGVGGVMVAGLMLLGFFWMDNTIPYYMLDIVAGCLLLLALVHERGGGRVARVLVGVQLAQVILFAAPVFGLVLWSVYAVAGDPAATGNAILARYSLFGFILPYLAAAAVWLLVWRTVVAARRLLFAPGEETEE
ncbi:MAG: hypothetical protein AB1716_08995 [Planctomycetota bacterium]